MTYIIHHSKFLRYQERKIRNFHSRVRGVVLSNNGTSIDIPFMISGANFAKNGSGGTSGRENDKKWAGAGHWNLVGPEQW